MTEDQNKTKQDLRNQIQAIMADVKKIDDKTKSQNDELDLLEKEFDTTADSVEKDLEELEKIEKDTDESLDNLIPEKAEEAGDDGL